MMARKDLKAKKLDAEQQKSAAQRDAMAAAGRAKAAGQEMQEISGVKQKIADVTAQAKADAEAERTKFEAWDAARERRFNARLDQADAKLREWKAKVEIMRAEEGMREHDLFADLKESVELARARMAEWQHARHERRAQEAIADAERHFEQAFDAASSRYEP
jgi:hypothetical protein